MSRPRFGNRVKETSATTSTGPYVLDGSVGTFRRVRDYLPDGEASTFIAVDDPVETVQWEIFKGTLTIDVQDELSRDSLLMSSTGEWIEWASGAKTIVCVADENVYNSIIDTLDSDLVTTGDGSSYSIASYRPGAGLYEGRFVCARLHAASADNPTLTVDDTGAHPIKRWDGAAPLENELPAGAYYWWKYSATAEAWIIFSPIDAFAKAGGEVTGPLTMVGAAINTAKATEVASATTIDLNAVDGNFIPVTGDNAISAVTLAAGRERVVLFTGAPLLVDGANLLLGGASIQTAAGDVAAFTGDGDGKTRLTGFLTNRPAIGQGGGGLIGLKVLVTGNAAVDVDADAATVFAADGRAYTLRSVDLSLNLASTGANGRDGGSEAANTWYHVFIIYNPATNAVAGLLSASATAPTLPSGYTAWRLVGAVRNNGSSNLFRTLKRGNRTVYLLGTNPTVHRSMAAGAAGSFSPLTWAAVATGDFVPPTATEIDVHAVLAGSNQAVIVAPNNSYGGTVSADAPPPLVLSSAASGNGYSARGTFLLESTDIYWVSSTGNGNLMCLGWTDQACG